MKKLPFVQRVQRLQFTRDGTRDAPSGIFVPHDSRRPFRLWMTGSLAVVMAAMIPIRDVSDTDRSSAMRLLRHSRFGVSETVQRIEAAARDHGLSVLALISGAQPVLVLASSIGGTLVVMDEADSQPAMPLSVMVRESHGGGAEVLVSSASQADVPLPWGDLPPQVAGDIESLPGLVDHALL